VNPKDLIVPGGGGEPITSGGAYQWQIADAVSADDAEFATAEEEAASYFAALAAG
jgi:hypothetical protein